MLFLRPRHFISSFLLPLLSFSRYSSLQAEQPTTNQLRTVVLTPCAPPQPPRTHPNPTTPTNTRYHRNRKALESRSFVDEEKLTLLESQVTESRYIAEDADHKYDEVICNPPHSLPPRHSLIATLYLPLPHWSLSPYTLYCVAYTRTLTHARLCVSMHATWPRVIYRD